MRTAQPTPVFPARYVEHVAYAMYLAGTNGFTTLPAAVASVYLATRFEFYFRMLSGKLCADGTWLSPSAQQAAQTTLPDPRLNQRRVANIALAYEIMMIGTARIIPYCALLDRSLYTTPTSATGKFTIKCCRRL